jgi:hypothetical protein
MLSNLRLPELESVSTIGRQAGLRTTAMHTTRFPKSTRARHEGDAAGEDQPPVGFTVRFI